MEVIIASVILAIIVGSSMTFMSNTETKDTFRGKVQTESTCLAEAHKTLASIKEKGHSRHIVTYPSASIRSGDYTIASGQLDQLGLSTTEYGIVHSHRWPSPIMEVAPDANVLRPHLLIMGYMNALQAMYNSNPTGFCDTASELGRPSYGPGVIIRPSTSVLGSGFGNAYASATAYLRIQVYNTSSGGISCPGSINIRPPGADEANLDARRRRPRMTTLNETPAKNLPHPNDVNEEVFDEDPTVVHNRGFLVTSTVQYTDRKGQTRSCSVQEKFQYNAMPENSLTYEFEDIEASIDDEDVPEDINTTVTSTGVQNPPRYDEKGMNLSRSIYNGCAETNARDVSIRLTRVRAGSIFMCRDLSTQRAATAYPGAGWDYSTNSANHTHGYNGFAMRFSEPMRTTFYSTELLQHAYWADRENDDTSSNLFIAGLYYPEGTYYCLGEMGCAAGNAGTSTNELINRALPRFPGGSWNPTGTSVAVGTYRYFVPSNHSAGSDLTANWVPCERMAIASYRICGSGTVSSVASELGFSEGSGTSTTRRDAFHMKFENLPGGCEVHVQIAEVDAGYNVKATEFKEYIQEKVPGNKLCRNQNLSNARFDKFNPMGAGTWFFACSNVYADAAGAPECDATETGDCCIDYPFYPHYRSHIDP